MVTTKKKEKRVRHNTPLGTQCIRSHSAQHRGKRPVAASVGIKPLVNWDVQKKQYRVRWSEIRQECIFKTGFGKCLQMLGAFMPMFQCKHNPAFLTSSPPISVISPILSSPAYQCFSVDLCVFSCWLHIVCFRTYSVQICKYLVSVAKVHLSLCVCLCVCLQSQGSR